MKRTLICIILAAILALFLYAAHLDGVFHISASALNKCEFCEFIESYDLDAEAEKFPANVTGANYEIDFELALYAHLTHGHGRVARHILQYNVPMVYCPECGRLLK